MMIPHTMGRPSTTLGAFGSSRSARSGAIFQYVVVKHDASVSLLTPLRRLLRRVTRVSSLAS